MFRGALAKEVMMHADFAIWAFADSGRRVACDSSLASHAVALCVGGTLLTCHSLYNALSHCDSAVPACSATIYLAYQSGQFASL